MHKKFKILLAGIFLSILLLPFNLFAQQQGIQISPLTYKFEIAGGGSQEAKVLITNLSTTDLDFVMETENFTKTSEEGAPTFSGPTVASGVTTLAEWINFKTAKEGTLKPREEKEILFTIDVPELAEPGGHYAAVFVKGVKKNAQGQTELGVASRVGTLFLVTVPGETVKTGELIETQSPKIVWQGPIDFTAKFQNTGTVHYEAPVSVELKPIIGKSTTVDLGKHIVLPDSVRDYKGQLNKKYPFGWYKVTFTALDGNGKAYTDINTLIAIPLMIVIPIIVAIALIIYIIKYAKKHFKIVTKK